MTAERRRPRASRPSPPTRTRPRSCTTPREPPAAQGRRARARLGAVPVRDHTPRSRSAPRRRLLVHGRSGLGHGNLLRHHRPLGRGRDPGRVRGGFSAQRWYEFIARHRVTVFYTAPTAIRMLMKAPPPDAEQLPAFATCAAWASRSIRGRAVGRAGHGAALPRHLLADRDRRHHDLQRSGLPIKPGSMGKPVPGIAGRHPGSQTFQPITVPGARWADRLPAALAVHVPRLLQGREDLPEQVRGRLLPDRRSRQRGQRRLLLVRGPRRRRHQHRGPPGGAVRGRERACCAPGGGRIGGGEQARPDLRRGGQVVHRAAPGHAAATS
jgi:hypothetical protein